MKSLFVLICGGSIIGVGILVADKINTGDKWDLPSILFILALLGVALLTGYGVWKIEKKEMTTNTKIDAIARKLNITNEDIERELNKQNKEG